MIGARFRRVDGRFVRLERTLRVEIRSRAGRLECRMRESEERFWRHFDVAVESPEGDLRMSA